MEHQITFYTPIYLLTTDGTERDQALPQLDQTPLLPPMQMPCASICRQSTGIQILNTRPQTLPDTSVHLITITESKVTAIRLDKINRKTLYR